MAEPFEKRLEGEISYFNRPKKYGFIRTVEGDSYFFYSDSHSRKGERQGGLIRRMFSPFAGDSVSFLIRPSQQKKGEWEAYALEWIGNSHKESLLSAMETKPSLLGEIVTGVGSTYYLKPENHKCWLKIVPGAWDEDFPGFLEDKEGVWVNFKLVHKSNLQLMKAILLNAKKTSTYHWLKSHADREIPVPLRIKSIKNSKIIVETIDHGIEGMVHLDFISDSGELLWIRSLKKDRVVDGYIRYIFLTYKRILVDFFRPASYFSEFNDRDEFLDQDQG